MIVKDEIEELAIEERPALANIILQGGA